MTTQSATPMVAQAPLGLSIPVAQIRESKLNHRKTFEQGKLNELAISIRKSGIWTPLLVRPNGTDKGLPVYEIAAGHRRFRAALIAGLAEAPCLVRELSDQQFAELITFENLGREDVHPLEEAAGFESLIRDYGYTAAAISEKVGCHESYVHKRLRLAQLIEPARKAFADGEITLQHAVQIARLDTPARQKEAFALAFEERWDHKTGKHGKEVVSAKALDSRIREQLFLNLSAAPWKKDDATLVPKAGLCTTCPKRTGANHQLFDDVTKGDNCLDQECFERKRNAFIRITTAQHALDTGKSMARVATRWCPEPKKFDCLQSGSYTKVSKNNRCHDTEKAIVVYGDDSGQVIEICIAAKCPKHGNAVTGQYGTYKRTEREIAAERKRKLDAKIDVLYRQKLWLETWAEMQENGDLNPPAVKLIAHYLIERIGHDGRGPLVKVLDLKPEAKANSRGYEDTNSELLRAYFAKLDNAAQIMFLLALATAPALGSMFSPSLKSLEEVAADCGLAPGTIKKQVAAPLQEKAKKAATNAKKKAKAEEKAAPAKGKAKPAAAAAELESEDDDDYEGDDYENGAGDFEEDED